MKRINTDLLARWGMILLFVAMMGVPYFTKGCGWLSLLGFTPLLLMEAMMRRKGERHIWLHGAAAFLLFNLFTTWWLWCVEPMAMVMANLVNTLAMSGVWALFLLCRRLCSKASAPLRDCLPYLCLAAFWLAWEHIYHNIEISWPWLTLGNAFATTVKLVQWYENTGALGGSLWILGSSIFAFFAIRAICDSKKMTAASLIALASCTVLIPAAVSLVRYYTYEEKGDPVEVAFAQPNVDPYLKYGYLPQDSLDNRILELFDSVITPRTGYVITPETFTFDIDLDNPLTNPSFAKYVRYLEAHPDVDMLLGALTYRTFYGRKPTVTARRYGAGWVDVYNAATVIDHTGVINRRSTYFKSKLVPGVEFIPYHDKLLWLGPIFEKFGGSASSYARQSSMNAISGRGPLRFAPIICYESVYGDYCTGAIRDGANVIAVITNDGWWGDTPGHTQHFNFAALRAVETRRDVVHVANNGTSGFINQRGDVIAETPWWTETAMVGNVHPNRSMTAFAIKGDVIGRTAVPVAAALLLLSLCVAFRFRKVCKYGKN